MTATQTSRPGARPSRVVLLVLGSLAALIVLGLLIGGAVLGWLYVAERDDDGFFTSPTGELETTGYALRSEELDLGANHDGPDWDVGGVEGLAPVRLTARALGEATRSSWGSPPRTMSPRICRAWLTPW
jgi:hypothetical protein